MFLSKKIYASAAAFILAAAVVCSCTGTKENTASSKELSEFMPITEIEEGRKNFYLIVKDIDDQYWKVLSRGAAASGSKYDVNIYMSGSEDETEIDQQVDLIDKAVEKGADAVIIAPDDAVKLSECVSRVHAQGIPVVLADTMVNCQDYDVCYMTDNMIAGRTAAKTLIESLHKKDISDTDKINVAILTGAVTVPSLSERIAGFCGYWADNAPENWKIIDDICKSNDYEDAVGDIKKLFSHHKEINAVFAANYFTAAGFADYLKSSGRKDIVLLNFDFPEEIDELMSDESYTVSSVLQNNYDMGYKAVKACVDLCNGITPDTKFIDTGIIVFDRETRNTPQVQNIFSHY